MAALVSTPHVWPQHRHAVDPPALDSLCVVEDGERVTRVSCDKETPLYNAPNRVRYATGAKLCWWTATSAELETINGVGQALSLSLAAHNLDVQTPDGLVELTGVGPHLAAVIADEVTWRCPHPQR